MHSDLAAMEVPRFIAPSTDEVEEGSGTRVVER
jgi:hypothetical protein